MDQQGNTVDFLLSAKRDQAAAMRFLREAIVAWRRPTKLTLDKYQANHAAGEELNGIGYLKRPTIRTTNCLTNRIERDHGCIKQRVRGYCQLNENPTLKRQFAWTFSIDLSGIRIRLPCVTGAKSGLR